MKQVIRFSSFGGYRRFCRYWWQDLFWYLTKGCWKDIYTYWHRARYGWAPSDVWNLDGYISRVLSGTLNRMADITDGTPGTYPYQTPHVWGDDGIVRPFDEAQDDYDDIICDHGAWQNDLRRWAKAFEDASRDNIFDMYREQESDDEAWLQLVYAEERRRDANVARAMKEMAPWYRSLWN